MSESSTGQEQGFTLGTPTLVCRWRIASQRLPMANRHLRALGARFVNGGTMPKALVAWAKQHVEWTLEDGSARWPDGVLMIVVDQDGKAAMTVGPYKPLQRTSTQGLLERARYAEQEGNATNVAPETLWAVRGEDLVWGMDPDQSPSGAATLVRDLALTVGMNVVRDAHLMDEVERGDHFDELFLVSDEHGVVPASDAAGRRAQRFADGYQKLLDSMARKR